MEPQLLIASLYEHVPGRTTGQHDLGQNQGGPGARFDTVGVIIALLAMIGIMVAMAMMGSEGRAAFQATENPHMLISTR